jgi:trigger factor
MSTSSPETESTSTSAPEEKKRLNLEVKIEKPSACKRHVTVTVSREDVDRYVAEAFSELKPKAEIPGFRPGRAPRKLVESRFKEQVTGQVKGSIVMDSLAQINEVNQLTAISEPDFDYDAVVIPDEGPMTFEFNLEVRPEFDLPVWKGLKLERPTHTYSEEEVNKQLKQLLERFGKLVPIDGPAKGGDTVVVNATFRSDGQVVSEIKDAEVRVRPVLSLHDAKMKDFGSTIEGAKAGDKRSGKITISPDAKREDLRGKEVDVEFEVLDVKEIESPELNRDFLDRIGGFNTEAEVLAAVREELERQLTYHQQRRVRQQITALLTAAASWELPIDMLRRQARRELDRAVLELRSSGFSDDEINAHANELRQNSMATTATALKEHFILERIAEDEKIEAEPGDYDDEVKLIADQSEESPRRVRARLEKRGLDTLRNQIVERKVIKLIEEHAEFKDGPFVPKQNDTVAADFAVCGAQDDEDIPEAKHGGTADAIPGQLGQADRR